MIRGFDTHAELLSALGRYWTSVFSQPGLVRALCAATAEVHDMILADLARCADEANRRNVTTTAVKHWVPLVLSSSRAGGPGLLWRVSAVTPLLCGARVAGLGMASSVPSVGGSRPVAGAAPYSAELGDVTPGMLVDNPFSPGRVYVPGADFDYADGGIVFYHGADPVAAAADAADSVVVYAVDIATTNARGLSDIDISGVGGGLGAPALNSLWDLRTMGGSHGLVSAAACLITGVPVSLVPDTVVEILTDHAGVAVVTDTTVHRVPAGQTLRRDIVAGARLHVGHPLTTAVIVFNPAAGTPAMDLHGGYAMSEVLPYLHVPGGLFGSTRGVCLGWGHTRPVRVGTAYRFPVSGTDEAVAAWWAYMDDAAARVGWGALLPGAAGAGAAPFSAAEFAVNSLFLGRGLWVVVTGVRGPEGAWAELLAAVDARTCAQVVFVHAAGAAARPDISAHDSHFSCPSHSVVERSGATVVSSRRMRRREAHGYHYVSRTA